MLGRQFDTLCRHQIEKRRVRLRQVPVHRLHHFTDGVRAGHFEYFGMDFLDDIVAVGILFGTETAGDDHLAVFAQRLTDGVQ